MNTDAGGVSVISDGLGESAATFDAWLRLRQNQKYTQPQDMDAWLEAAFDAGKRAALVTVDKQPHGWLCSKCGADRTKAACPKGHSAALTGECPMIGTAA